MKTHRIISVLLALSVSFSATGCVGKTDVSPKIRSNTAAAAEPEAEKKRETRISFPVPEAAGTAVYSHGGADLDASHIEDGYVMIKYGGTAENAKVRISTPRDEIYTYTLTDNEYGTFPLTCGEGDYRIEVLENAYDNMYALIFAEELYVIISDEFSPFLLPNQYVWFEEGMETVKLGRSMSDESSGDIDYLSKVYHYVIENIGYDYDKARDVPAGYVPSVDDVLATKKGICFDYASLMAALLRSQGIPTKLLVGYSGEAYHAWISVYIKETGWIDNIFEFDGIKWKMMDPTYAANHDTDSVKQYVGDGANYRIKYSY